MAQLLLVLAVEIALARLLGASGFGLYSYAIVWVLVLAVPQSGLAILVLRETARGMARTDAESVRHVRSWSHRVVGLYTALLMAAALCLFLAVGALNLSARLRVVLLSLPLVPLLGLTYVCGASLRGLGQVMPGLIVELLLLPAVFLLLLGLLALPSGAGLLPEQAIAARIAAAALTVVVGHRMLLRYAPVTVRNGPPRRHSNGWLRSLGPFAGMAFLDAFNVYVNGIILGAFHPVEEVGIFRIASQTATLAGFGLIAVNAVLPQQFAAAHARGEFDRLQRLARLSAMVSFAFAATTTLGCFLVGRPLLGLAFGPPFAAAYLPLLILLAGQLVYTACGSVRFLLTMTGHERDALLASVVSTLANLGLSLSLVPSFGTPAAAAAAALSLMIWSVVMSLSLRYRTGIVSTLSLVVRK